jgi:hypothetical protein
MTKVTRVEYTTHWLGGLIEAKDFLAQAKTAHEITADHCNNILRLLPKASCPDQWLRPTGVELENGAILIIFAPELDQDHPYTNDLAFIGLVPK